MGHGIKLSAEQWEELDNLRLRTPSANIFRNCLIILMSDCRETVGTIAGRLGCGTDTVIRVRRLYRNGGINALYPIKPLGRPCRATPEFLRHTSSAVQANPMTLGYGFSTWSATRLAEHLAAKGFSPRSRLREKTKRRWCTAAWIIRLAELPTRLLRPRAAITFWLS